MSRLPDLVLDSRLRTEFCDWITVHSYREIDDRGKRFSREEHWKWERLLGRGGFGQVRLERCIAKGAKENSLRAVKIINKPLHPSESFSFNRELEAIAKFSNIRYKRWFVRSFGWFEDESSIFIAMEYCHQGDLQHYLQIRHVVPAGEVQQLAYQILEGLDQMHQNDFAHRDLKPGNILIKSMPPEENWWIVLADFGISKRADGFDGPTTTIKGTPTFMAPELLGYLGQARPKTIADFKATDMWALGEIVFQMFTGKATFQNPLELMKYCIGQGEFPLETLTTAAEEDGRAFVTGIMTALPQDRMDTSECIRHPWIKSLRLEEGFMALELEQSNLPNPEQSMHDELASARWTTQSDLQYHTGQARALQRPDITLRHESPVARPVQPGSESCTPPFQLDPCLNDHPSVSRRLTLMQTLEENGGRTDVVVFSPDGNMLAIAATDPWVRIVDTVLGSVRHTLTGHKDFIFDVAFSPDSKILASASYDRTIRLWKTNSGHCIHKLHDHVSWIHSIAFSLNGFTLASGSSDTTVRLRNVTSGEVRNALKGHANKVILVRYSPNGQALASASLDCTVKIWDCESGEMLHTLDAFEGNAFAFPQIIFSPDSKLLASMSRKRAIRIWNVASGELMHSIQSDAKVFMTATFSADNNLLASAYFDGLIELWDVQSWTVLRTLKGHMPFAVHDIAFSPDNRTLASASRDETVKIWDVGSGLELQSLEDHCACACRVLFSPDGMMLASVSMDSTINFWA